MVPAQKQRATLVSMPSVHHKESSKPKARKTHRDLVAWQASMQLLVEAYRVAARLPEIERYGLASQLRRASVSVVANIAEGFGRSARGDYLRHLSIASGSLREIQTHLEAITLLRYLPQSAIEVAENASHRAGFLLRRLQTSLLSR